MQKKLLYVRYFILNISGGPTEETRGILNLSIQYWTSRGWAVVDVNYGGSTGLFLILSTTSFIPPFLTVEALDFVFILSSYTFSPYKICFLVLVLDLFESLETIHFFPVTIKYFTCSLL